MTTHDKDTTLIFDDLSEDVKRSMTAVWLELIEPDTLVLLFCVPDTRVWSGDARPAGGHHQLVDEGILSDAGGLTRFGRSFVARLILDETHKRHEDRRFSSETFRAAHAACYPPEQLDLFGGGTDADIMESWKIKGATLPDLMES
jgi:hypothetical protein